jgi:hypothetical protein
VRANSSALDELDPVAVWQGEIVETRDHDEHLHGKDASEGA